MAKVLTHKRRCALLDILDFYYTNTNGADDEFIERHIEMVKILEDFIK